jgi:hypothetical protein
VGYCCPDSAIPISDPVRSLTFDLRNGEEVSFESLFKDYTLNRKEILGVIFAERIKLTDDAGKKAKNLQDNGSCENDTTLYSIENLTKEWAQYYFNFSRTGLSVQPTVSFIDTACVERVTVPYSKLKQFAAQGGLIERVMETPAR